MKTKKSYGKEADTAFATWIAVSRTFRTIRSLETAYIEAHGVTIHQFGVLEALYHMGSLTVGELTRLVLSTPGNMTVVIKNLREKNLIESVQDEKDRRISRLSITQAGADIVAGIFEEHAEKMTGFFKCLSAEEQDVLTSLLRRLEKANRRQQ